MTVGELTTVVPLALEVAGSLAQLSELHAEVARGVDAADRAAGVLGTRQVIEAQARLRLQRRAEASFKDNSEEDSGPAPHRTLRGAIDFHLERHRTNYQSGRGSDKLPGIRRGGAPQIASGPSGGASKPRAAKGAFGMAPDKTPRRGAGMAGGNMFTPAHDLKRHGGGMGARRGRR